MINEISIYQNNSKTVIATITGLDTLSGYTAVFTAKKEKADILPVISSTGSTDGLTVTFELAPAETDLPSGNYHYDVVLSNGIKNYTAIQSELKIIDSVKY